MNREVENCMQPMNKMIYAKRHAMHSTVYIQITRNQFYDGVLIIKISRIACASMVAFFFCRIHFCLTACIPRGL